MTTELTALNIKNFMRNKLCVCLPVFNEEKFFEETLIFVLNHSYTDFELVIPENN